LRKHEFVAGQRFYTVAGVWLCVEVTDKAVVAKLIADRGGIEKLDGPVITFDERTWAACMTEVEFRSWLALSSGTTYSTRPCFRCHRRDRSLQYTLLRHDFVRVEKITYRTGAVVMVCELCKLPQDRSSHRFGSYHWICACGANIWWDGLDTGEKCINCGRGRQEWTFIGLTEES
jgi:hypothetical protein